MMNLGIGGRSMLQKINGQKLAEQIKDRIVKEIVKLGGKRPNLAIVLIGERDDSDLYVKLKEREAKKVGVDTHLYKCPESITQKEILNILDTLNHDPVINGILVQLPINKKFNTDEIIKAINPNKDVDRFHPENLKKLFKKGHEHDIISPVFSSILESLKSIHCQLKDSSVCVICNSDIFGKNLKKMLDYFNAKTIVTHLSDKNYIEKTKQADILITALGSPKIIKRDMIKKEAILIDIGITKQGKKVLGDVDFESVKNKASFITPVPGGIGPLTIAMVLKNTLELYQLKNK
jgi:methylenetetrahydrofolate dehydrogenase (NADP+)/methenyltetrahydrofolate cyclohydrolase